MKKTVALVILLIIVILAARHWRQNNPSWQETPARTSETTQPEGGENAADGSRSASTSPTPSPELFPKTKHTFILTGDTGSGLPGQTKVAAAIKKYCERQSTLQAPCTAAFLHGDIIYEKGVTSATDPQFRTKFEEPYKELEFPFYIAYGNHDYQGCTECYLEYAKKSAAQKWKMPSRYYVQSFPDIDFFMIDTEKFDKTQQNWLREQLQKSTANWKIVGGHRPIISFETTKLKENWSGKEELKNIVCNSANYYVSGHAHVLEDNGSPEGCDVKLLVTGGGGASIRTVEESEQAVFVAAELGFIGLTVHGSEGLQVEFVNTEGKVIHQTYP